MDFEGNSYGKGGQIEHLILVPLEKYAICQDTTRVRDHRSYIMSEIVTPTILPEYRL